MLDLSKLPKLWERIGLPRLDEPTPAPLPAPAAPPASVSDDDAKLPERTIPTAAGDTAAPVKIVAYGDGAIKPYYSRVLTNQTVAYSGVDSDVDCRFWNAAHIEVIVAGTSPVATLTLYTAIDNGSLPAIPIQHPLASQVITTSTAYDVPVGGNWLRLALTGISGAGATFTIYVTPFLMGATSKVTAVPLISTPTFYAITLTSINTEYSQALPNNCGLFEFQCRTAVDVRWAVVTGKVAASTDPFGTLKSGTSFTSPPINQGGSPSTLYFASGTGGVVVELIAWT